MTDQQLTVADLFKLMDSGCKFLGLSKSDLKIPGMRRYRSERELEAGDMVVVYREVEHAHVHTGIYLGEGRVADFWGEDKQTSRIAIRPYKEFICPGVELAMVDFADAFPKEVSVNLARWLVDQVQDGHRVISYNARLANCQHFATWCRTGNWDSHQVRVVDNAIHELFAQVVMKFFGAA